MYFHVLTILTKVSLKLDEHVDFPPTLKSYLIIGSFTFLKHHLQIVHRNMELFNFWRRLRGVQLGSLQFLLHAFHPGGLRMEFCGTGVSEATLFLQRRAGFGGAAFRLASRGSFRLRTADPLPQHKTATALYFGLSSRNRSLPLFLQHAQGAPVKAGRKCLYVLKRIENECM